MKYIERSGRKTNFSPWRLGGRKYCSEDEGEGSMEDKHPREDASLTLELLGHRRGRLEGGGTSHSGERERLRGGNGSGV
jgi:hypothetical protein